MSPDDSRERIEWSQVWYPGPTRVFTPEEMALAGDQQPTRTLTAAVLVNYALLGFMLMQMAPPAATAALTGVLALAGLLGSRGALALWRKPTRRGLSWWTLLGVVALMGSTWLVVELKHLPRGSDLRAWALGTGVVMGLLLSTMWWFITIYRAHQIEARLRELAEQRRALDMARQLAAAQIQPHFLYNALAALQHWVQTKDDRAAPLLGALTGFLRATLPLFNQQRLALGDEAEAVRQYLEVMRLRLGQRLRYELHITTDAAAAQVPPGLLLTLVENAVEHGVAPSLNGASVQVHGRVQAGELLLSVHDTGPGLAPGIAEGTGLANTRTRLAQAFGAHASLELHNAPEGGCVARIRCPLQTTPPAPPTTAQTPP
jgi:signal transduction histidine kinase